MSLSIIAPGLQTTLQGAPREGHRHLGVPAAGPADALSMALANRLVSNGATTTALEISFGGFAAQFNAPAAFALTGAEGAATLNGVPLPFHRTANAAPGDVLKLGAPACGVRTYLAIAGGISAPSLLGSCSTLLAAELGGHQGRALRAGDEIAFGAPEENADLLETPPAWRPAIGASFALRACPSAEFHLLDHKSQDALFSQPFKAARQVTRMGVAFEGAPLHVWSDGKMESAAVFPGTLQCPPNGAPILLLADAQTTGGYPRIAHIARADRHLMGQIAPGTTVHLLNRTPESAAQDLRRKSEFLTQWLPDFSL